MIDDSAREVSWATRAGARQGRAALAALAALSALILALVTAATPQGLYSDPAWQLLAVQQHLRGETAWALYGSHPDPADLARDRLTWGVWWAPGTPLLAYPLLAAGLTVGAAVRALTVACLVLGAVGWARWAGLFALPGPLRLALALLLPWMRYASNGLFLYSAEALVFAATPWLLLATHRLGRMLTGERPARVSTAILAGLLLGGAYVLKYSAFISSVGALAYLCGLLWRRPARRPAALLGLAGLACAAPVLVLSFVNSALGGSANQLTASAALQLRPQSLLFLLGNPALALADADSVLRFVLMHPSRAITGDPLWLAVAGLPGGATLAWLLARRPISGAERLALIVFATSAGAMLLVWTVSSGASYEARHLAGPALAVLPLVLSRGWRLARVGRPALRLTLAAAGLCYIGLPLAYGAGSVALKVWRMPEGYAAGPAGIYNPLLARGSIPAVREAILAGFRPGHDVLYLTDPLTALDLPGRAIVRHADFTDAAELARDRFVSSRPMRVFAVLPDPFEADGKGAIIRAGFPQAVAWERLALPEPGLGLWVGRLQP